MSMFLLAASARGFFIAMLAIMIVVLLLFGFLMFMLLRPVKKPPEAVDADNVRALLAHRESSLTVELMNTKEEGEARTSLINKLRRVKSAQLLIDELVEEEKNLEGAVEAEEKERSHRDRSKSRNGEKPARGEKPSKPEKDKKNEHSEQPEKDKKPEKGDKKPKDKKKDDKEFKPSAD